LEEFGLDKVEGINFHEPFGYLDYNHLQMNAKCVISDSGTISEEAAIIGFPAVSLRDSIERPESLDSGAMILAGLDPANLVRAINMVVSTDHKFSNTLGYGEANFSEVVTRFLFSSVTKHAAWMGLRRK
jgi:UDP-N-acetylglucosamine 2-epimerase (non-hydrolysing)